MTAKTRRGIFILAAVLLPLLALLLTGVSAENTQQTSGVPSNVVIIPVDGTITAFGAGPGDPVEVKFIDHDGTVLDTQTLLYGDPVTPPSPDPTRMPASGEGVAAWQFAGWVADPLKDPDTGLPVVMTAITCDVDFHATYDAYYEVTFINDDGTVLSDPSLNPQLVAENDPAILPLSNPTWPGTPPPPLTYLFTGWAAENPDDGTPIIMNVTDNIISNVTFRAVYQPSHYEVKLIDHDGTLLNTLWVPVNTAITPQPADPTRTATPAEGDIQWVFDGWAAEDPSTTPPDPLGIDIQTDPITDNVTFRATYKACYEVTFINHNGSTVLATQLVEKGTAVPTIPSNPAWAGALPPPAYAFDHWAAENPIGTPITMDVTDNVTSKVTFRAVYRPTDYKVTFIDHDGTVLSTLWVPENTAIASLPADPTRTATPAEGDVQWEFVSWAAENPIGTPITMDVTGNITSDVFFRATYAKKTPFTVQYVLATGHPPVPAPGLPPDYKEYRKLGESVTITVPSPAITDYVADPATVSFTGVMGDDPSKETVTVTYYKLLKYTVQHWFETDDAVANDVAPTWGNASQFTLDSSLNDTATMPQGDVVSVTDKSSLKPGYTMMSAPSGDPTTTPNITDNAVFDVYYEKKIYELTFDANLAGAPVPPPVPVKAGNKIGALPTPTHPGYTLIGWFPDAAGSGTQYTADFRMPASDLTVYGKWSRLFNVRFIHYEKSDSTSYSTLSVQLVADGLKAMPPQEPTREPIPADGVNVAWKFIGWEALDAGGALIPGMTVNDPITADTNFRAIYEKLHMSPFTVEYKLALGDTSTVYLPPNDIRYYILDGLPISFSIISPDVPGYAPVPATVARTNYVMTGIPATDWEEVIYTKRGDLTYTVRHWFEADDKLANNVAPVPPADPMNASDPHYGEFVQLSAVPNETGLTMPYGAVVTITDKALPGYTIITQKRGPNTTDNAVFDVYYKKNAYTLSYDPNAEGVYIPTPVTVKFGNKIPLPPGTEMALMARAGYDFAHWFEYDDGTGTLYDGTNGVMPADDMAIYAQWDARNNVPYKLVHWLEKPNIKGVFPATYTVDIDDFIWAGETTGLMGTAGATVAVGDPVVMSNLMTFTIAGKPGIQFAYYRTNVATEINGDGTTIVNVYYTRIEFQFELFPRPSATGTPVGTFPGYTNGQSMVLSFKYEEQVLFLDGRAGSWPYPLLANAPVFSGSNYLISWNVPGGSNAQSARDILAADFFVNVTTQAQASARIPVYANMTTTATHMFDLYTIERLPHQAMLTNPTTYTNPPYPFSGTYPNQNYVTTSRAGIYGTRNITYIHNGEPGYSRLTQGAASHSASNPITITGCISNGCDGHSTVQTSPGTGTYEYGPRYTLNGENAQISIVYFERYRYTVAFDKNTSSTSITAPSTMRGMYGLRYSDWNYADSVVAASDRATLSHLEGGVGSGPWTKGVGPTYTDGSGVTWVFDGWHQFKEVDSLVTLAGGGAGDYTIPAQNTTLYAHWKAMPVKVTLKIEGNPTPVLPATEYPAFTLLQEAFKTQPDMTNYKPGYTFLGWYDLGANVYRTGALKLTTDITLEARFTPKPTTYTIWYLNSDDSDAEITAHSTVTGVVVDEIINESAPAIAGFTLDKVNSSTGALTLREIAANSLDDLDENNLLADATTKNVIIFRYKKFVSYVYNIYYKLYPFDAAAPYDPDPAYYPTLPADPAVIKLLPDLYPPELNKNSPAVLQLIWSKKDPGMVYFPVDPTDPGHDKTPDGKVQQSQSITMDPNEPVDVFFFYKQYAFGEFWSRSYAKDGPLAALASDPLGYLLFNDPLFPGKGKSNIGAIGETVFHYDLDREFDYLHTDGKIYKYRYDPGDTRNVPSAKLEDASGTLTLYRFYKFYRSVYFVADSNGAIVDPSGTLAMQEVPNNAPWSAVTVPGTDPAPGYYFAGWDLTFPATVADDLTFTAKFERSTLSIKVPDVARWFTGEDLYDVTAAEMANLVATPGAGTPWDASKYEIQYTSLGSFVYVKNIIMPGTYSNWITIPKTGIRIIEKATGTDVTALFEITAVVPGNLTILNRTDTPPPPGPGVPIDDPYGYGGKPIPITLRPKDGKLPFNGFMQTYNTTEYTFVAGSKYISSSMKISKTEASGQGQTVKTHVGVVTFTTPGQIKITYLNDSNDITQNYKITTEAANLEISGTTDDGKKVSVPMVMTANDLTLPFKPNGYYGGNPPESNVGVTATADGKPATAAEKYSYTGTVAYGEGTAPTAANKTIVVTPKVLIDGIDHTEYFAITKMPGRFTITAGLSKDIQIKVWPQDKTIDYNAADRVEHTGFDRAELVSGEPLPDVTITLEATGKGNLPGNYEIIIDTASGKPVVKIMQRVRNADPNADGSYGYTMMDLTQWYEILPQKGTLKINPVTIPIDVSVVTQPELAFSAASQGTWKTFTVGDTAGNPKTINGYDTTYTVGGIFGSLNGKLTVYVEGQEEAVMVGAYPIPSKGKVRIYGMVSGKLTDITEHFIITDHPGEFIITSTLEVKVPDVTRWFTGQKLTDVTAAEMKNLVGTPGTGTPLDPNRYEINYTSLALFDYERNIIAPGSYSQWITIPVSGIRIIDKANGQDVTGFFQINKVVPGDLTILNRTENPPPPGPGVPDDPLGHGGKPIPVTFRPKDGELPFNGFMQTYQTGGAFDIKVGSEYIPSGADIRNTNASGQGQTVKTHVGVVTFTTPDLIQIMYQENNKWYSKLNDLTSNYAITKLPADLKISGTTGGGQKISVPMVMTANDLTLPFKPNGYYGGKPPESNVGVTATVDGKPATAAQNYSYTGTVAYGEGTAPTAANKTIVVTPKVLIDGIDHTEYFAITKMPGKFTIIPGLSKDIQIKVWPQDKTIDYNATDRVEHTGFDRAQLVSGEPLPDVTITLEATGKGNLPGTYDIIIDTASGKPVVKIMQRVRNVDPNADGSYGYTMMDLTQWYEILPQTAKLTINPVTIPIDVSVVKQLELIYAAKPQGTWKTLTVGDTKGNPKTINGYETDYTVGGIFGSLNGKLTVYVEGQEEARNVGTYPIPSTGKVRIYGMVAGKLTDITEHFIITDTPGEFKINQYVLTGWYRAPDPIELIVEYSDPIALPPVSYQKGVGYEVDFFPVDGVPPDIMDWTIEQPNNKVLGITQLWPSDIIEASKNPNYDYSKVQKLPSQKTFEIIPMGLIMRPKPAERPQRGENPVLEFEIIRKKDGTLLDVSQIEGFDPADVKYTATEGVVPPNTLLPITINSTPNLYGYNMQFQNKTEEGKDIISVYGQVYVYANYPYSSPLVIKPEKYWNAIDLTRVGTFEQNGFYREDLRFLGWSYDVTDRNNANGAIYKEGEAYGNWTFDVYGHWTQLYKLTIRHVRQDDQTVEIAPPTILWLAEGEYHKFVPVKLPGYTPVGADYTIAGQIYMTAPNGVMIMPADEAEAVIVYAYKDPAGGSGQENGEGGNDEDGENDRFNDEEEVENPFHIPDEFIPLAGIGPQNIGVCFD